MNYPSRPERIETVAVDSDGPATATEDSAEISFADIPLNRLPADFQNSARLFETDDAAEVGIAIGIAFHDGDGAVDQAFVDLAIEMKDRADALFGLFSH